MVSTETNDMSSIPLLWTLGDNAAFDMGNGNFKPIIALPKYH